jgi:hypothetical protein
MKPQDLDYLRCQDQELVRARHKFATIIVCALIMGFTLLGLAQCDDLERGWPSDAHGLVPAK